MIYDCCAEARDIFRLQNVTRILFSKDTKLLCADANELKISPRRTQTRSFPPPRSKQARWTRWTARKVAGKGWLPHFVALHSSAVVAAERYCLFSLFSVFLFSPAIIHHAYTYIHARVEFHAHVEKCIPNMYRSAHLTDEAHFKVNFFDSSRPPSLEVVENGKIIQNEKFFAAICAGWLVMCVAWEGLCSCHLNHGFNVRLMVGWFNRRQNCVTMT